MILTTLLAAFTLASSPSQGASAPVPLLDNKQLRVAQSRLATEHPDLLTVVPIGESRAGRPIEALRLAAGQLTPGRPAILLVANLDGPYAWTSGLALHHVRALCERHAAGDAAARELLSTTTLYVVPRANPDGAEARFLEPLQERWATGHDVDDDRDGKRGEDDADDVNGDGLISWMRVPDPEGEWLPDPLDERAHVKGDRAEGRRGRWKIVREGRDDDGDDEVAEDPPRDAVVNRNFPHGWREHDPAAGLFPTDEPETLALVELVLTHPDIALVVTYGALDSVVKPDKPIADDAPSVKRVPPTGVRKSDAAALGELAKRYKELTGSKAETYAPGERDTGAVSRDGSFQAWCYHDRGLWTLDLGVWSVPLDAAAPADEKADEDEAEEQAAEEGTGEDATDDDAKSSARKPAKDEKPSDDAKRLRWIDGLAEEDTPRFLPWTAMQHPTLGPVEIGGFAPYATIEPPADERAELARKELDFLLSLGAALPRVRVLGCTFERLHDGLVKIEAAIESDGLLPVHGRAAELARAPRPIRVALELPSDAQVVAGRGERLVRSLDGEARREELTWLVGATSDEPFDPAAIRVVADTDHAGSVRVAPQAKR